MSVEHPSRTIEAASRPRTPDPAARPVLVPFVPEHLDGMTLREPERGVVASFGKPLTRLAARYAAAGDSHSLVSGEIVIASAGIIPSSWGTAEVWLFTDASVERHPVAFQRHVHKLMGHWRAAYGLHRIQCLCHPDFATSLRWLERLEFVCEGRLAAWGPDRQDYLLLARTWPDA